MQAAQEARARGVADMVAGAMGTDRDTVLDKTLPEMLRLSTGRIVEPQEVADAVVLLASPRSGGPTDPNSSSTAGC